MKPFILATALLVAVLPSFADSIPLQTVVGQDEGFVQVPLGPGLDPLLGPTFLGVVPPNPLDFQTCCGVTGTINEFSSVLDIDGLQLTNEATFFCFGKCSIGYGFYLPTLYHVTPGTLSVTLQGANAMYDFRYQTPAPEPTTLVLLGTGLMA